MLDKKVVELLNDQVNKEFYSAYLYLDFANYYKDNGLDGFANWYNNQAQEEETMQYYLFNIFKITMLITLEAIDKPDKSILN